MNEEASNEQHSPAAIPLHAVNSKRLTALGYDPATQTLAVEFPGKPGEDPKVYHYFGFPPEQYAELEKAESKGSFFEGHIRNVYDFQRIAPDVGARKTVERRTANEAA